MSQIGRPIDDPHMANIQLIMKEGCMLTSNLKQDISGIVNEELESMGKITDAILQRKAPLY